MARIPDEELERIKRNISLVDLVTASGVELKRKGKDYVGHCPYHNDRTPSLIVTPEKNLWHCMGACQEGGSVIDWVMKRDSVSFRHAVSILKQLLPDSDTVFTEYRFHSSMSDADLLSMYTILCHNELKGNSRCQDYLKKRGLDDSNLIDTFKLGFSDRKLGYFLPNRNTKEGDKVRSKMYELGIMRGSGHEHFSGSLVIPVFDGTGLVTEMYGRKITYNLRTGTAYHVYLPGPHKGVFNVMSLHQSKEVILCESLIDALTFYRHGFKNVTCSYGVNGFNSEILQAFRDNHIERVLIAYDRDEAGEKATESLSKLLIDEGFEVFWIKFPPGSDANSFAVSSSNPAEDIGYLIRHAEWIGKPIYNNKKIAAIAAKEEKREPAMVIPSGQNPLNIPCEIRGDDIWFGFDGRSWRVRGLDKNLSSELLKINLLVNCDDKFHVDTFDMYSARHRGIYVKQASIELELPEEIVKRDVGKILLRLEGIQQENIERELNSKPANPQVKLSDEEQAEALKLLKSPDLLNRILKDFKICGLVGETTNKLVGYLAAVSRKLDNPLALIVQSSSSAGKTWLMESVLSMMPPEERVKYSAMTGQSLYYLGESDLKHRILAIVEEEGAEKASYALKLLQSEGELSIASTGKDPKTGRLVTQEYRVEGPVMIFITTTSIDIDEELQNRCIILTVDESREQTRAIHQLQREKRTLEGLKRSEKKPMIRALHQNAQRLLKPLKVMNPYANCLTFLDDKTRTRRDHEKYLGIIDALAFLHQYQRENLIEGNLEYIVADVKDIETANRLAHEVLGRSLDELPPQTRTLLMKIEAMVNGKCEELEIKASDFRFSRRTVREYTNWGNTQLKIHLKRLEDMEYLVVHRGGRGQSFVYELLYNGEGKDGSSFLPGLLDVGELKKQMYDVNLSGVNGNQPGAGRPPVGTGPGVGRVEKNSGKPDDIEVLSGSPSSDTQNGLSGDENQKIITEDT